MRWLRAGFLPVSLVTLLSAAFIVPLPMYLERPGRSVSLASCVQVDDDRASDVDGDFLLMTINVLPSTTVDAVTTAFDDASGLVARHSIVPPGRDADTFFHQQRDLFSDRADVAAAVALEAAGFPVEMSRSGVVVERVEPGTPAETVLRPGDTIREIDGTDITSETHLRQVIMSAPRGRALSLRIARDGETVDATITPVLVDGRPVIGVHPRTITHVELPFEVDVASGSVGGPSAGLTIALTVYDKVLPDVDLAAGRVVAGTGSLDLDGRVGPVGGAGLKVVAAERLGADVFLVPAANLDEATRAATPGSSLRIIPVTTFEQARDVLRETAGTSSGSRRPAGRECVEPEVD